MKKMLEILAHRGPDDRGEWSDEWIMMGHNRLSILDLSPKGHQPMCRGNWIIAFNGEIYNYKEIREDLKSVYGDVFHTKTDTEVVLAAWERWSWGALEKLRGMWAFALYNKSTRELILSRDRFGIKPLYYFVRDDILLFASEIKALLACPIVPRKACLSIISDFLVVGFQDHREETFFEGIKQLPPGSCLEMNMEDGRTSIRSYYNLADRVRDREQGVKDFGKTLMESVKIHLRSDVPVGTCLSGGVDSSSIATIAAGLHRLEGPGKFQAITAKSSDPLLDETKYARLVVEKSDLQWHVVSPSADDFRMFWERCLWHQDEPAGTLSIFMQYWVMKTAQEIGLKVMLDGQGGDECLLGYERYYAPYLWRQLKGGNLKKAIREFIAASRNSNLGSHGLILYSFYFLCPELRKFRMKMRFGKFPPELIGGSLMRLEEAMQTYRHLQSMQVADIKFFVLPALLKYEDRNSMTWSIEARVPFVDHEVIECAIGLKDDLKIRNGYTKWALRETMDKKMDDAITWRRNKIGFDAPTKHWILMNKAWMTGIMKESVILRELGMSQGSKSENMFVRQFNLAHWEHIYKINL